MFTHLLVQNFQSRHSASSKKTDEETVRFTAKGSMWGFALFMLGLYILASKDSPRNETVALTTANYGLAEEDHERTESWTTADPTPLPTTTTSTPGYESDLSPDTSAMSEEVARDRTNCLRILRRPAPHDLYPYISYEFKDHDGRLRAAISFYAFVEHSNHSFTLLSQGEAAIAESNDTFMELTIAYECCRLGFSISRLDWSTPIRLTSQSYWINGGKGYQISSDYILSARGSHTSLRCSRDHSMKFGGDVLVLRELDIRAFPYYASAGQYTTPEDSCTERLSRRMLWGLFAVASLLLLTLLAIGWLKLNSKDKICRPVRGNVDKQATEVKTPRSANTLPVTLSVSDLTGDSKGKVWVAKN